LQVRLRLIYSAAYSFARNEGENDIACFEVEGKGEEIATQKMNMIWNQIIILAFIIIKVSF
jgi:hypothetical protein